MKTFALAFWLQAVVFFAGGYFFDRALRAPIEIKCTGHAEHQMTKPESFDTAREAALYAMRLVYQDNPYYESGGVIVRLDDNKFAIGKPHTDFAGDRVFSDRDPGDYDGEIIGDYHLHPCLSKTHVPDSFSPSDLAIYRTFHVIGYMGNACNGSLHEFITGVDVDAGDDGDSLGRVVGTFPVSGTQLDAGLPESSTAQWALPK